MLPFSTGPYIHNATTNTCTVTYGRFQIKKKPPWLWSASELCRPSDRRFLAK
jgi:hypothetical protein